MSSAIDQPESSNAWLPSVFGEDESTLQFFALSAQQVSESSQTSDSSSSGCSPTVSITISNSSYNYGNFTPPALNQLVRLQQIEDRFAVLRPLIESIVNKRWYQVTEEEVNQLNEMAKEVTTLANELAGMGLTFSPLIPLPVGPGITITVDSDPEGFSATIGIQELNVREGAFSKGKGIGTLDVSSGTTKFTAEYLLTGNYGSAMFTATVQCCDETFSSNPVTLTVTGECKGDAQRAFDASLARVENLINLLMDTMKAVAALLLAGTVLLTALAIEFPPAVLGALATFALALIAANAAYNIKDKWITEKGLMQAAAQPYIDSLPPCP